MDDGTWEKVVKIIAPVIRKMPIICDYPEWKVLITYNGFKYHVNVTLALEEFPVHCQRKEKQGHQWR